MASQCGLCEATSSAPCLQAGLYLTNQFRCLVSKALQKRPPYHAAHPPILIQLFWEVLLKAQPRGLELRCHPLPSWERPRHKKGDKRNAGDRGKRRIRGCITLRLPRTPSTSTQLSNSRLRNLFLLSLNVQSQRSCINGFSVGERWVRPSGTMVEAREQIHPHPTPPRPAVCRAGPKEVWVPSRPRLSSVLLSRPELRAFPRNCQVTSCL